MEPQKVIISRQLEQSLTDAIAEIPHDGLFVLCDDITRDKCLPIIAKYRCMWPAKCITIRATDTHKSLESLAHVWSELQRLGATRHSLMVNLGGGMVTDLGGFAASTFKRGIPYINIPTTLLSLVDASVGGKTGINFGGLKNEVGVFNNATAVILDTTFLRTLDRENILSGYAEMLKHGLITATDSILATAGHGSTRNNNVAADNVIATAEHGSTRNNNHRVLPCSSMAEKKLHVSPRPAVAEEIPMLGRLLAFDIEHPDLMELGRMVADSVAVKQRIVTEDPTEQGIRKALNLGHTAGHAFESLALERHPVLHGYAVAYGLVVELYLSCVKMGFPQDTMRQTVTFIKEYYGRMAVTCDDYPRLLELMHHDKKNVGDTINFTLLGDVGDIRINQTATEDEIKDALDFYREF
jgi:3-dehydroquinate synthase